MNDKFSLKSGFKPLLTLFLMLTLLSGNSFAASSGTSSVELKKEIVKNANKFGIQASIEAVEGKTSELAAALLMAANITKNIEGCELYVVFVSKEKPNLLLLTEVWTTQEAHKASLENAEIREIIEAARPLIKNIDNHWGLPLGGKGI